MRTQVAIVGGGPGGSACAIHLARRGISSIIVEKEPFPRFHIGESLTEQSGERLREMGLEDMMSGCPVKYGVRIYGPAGRTNFWIPVMKRQPGQALEDSFTWQVRRSTFDRMLLDHAAQLGVEVVRARATTPVLSRGGAVHGVSIQDQSGGTRDINCDVLVDASGQHTFLANAGLTGPKEHGRYHRQIAIYSHFTGAVRDSGVQWGNTLIFFQKKHYWAWFIPLDGDITSIGFVVPNEYFRSSRESTTAFLLRELRQFNTQLAARVEHVQLAGHVHTTSNYSYHIGRFSGAGWLCVGDAHRFIDPLFSFGVSVALADAQQSANAIREYFDSAPGDTERPFLDYERWSERGIDMCQTTLDGFWEKTWNFGMLLSRYREDFIDLLAGRVWHGEEYDAIAALRTSLAAATLDTCPSVETATLIDAP